MTDLLVRGGGGGRGVCVLRTPMILGVVDTPLQTMLIVKRTKFTTFNLLARKFRLSFRIDNAAVISLKMSLREAVQF